MPERIRDCVGQSGGVAVLVMAIVVLSGISIFFGAPARGVAYTLYGDYGLRGWGLTPGSISSPGPTLIAAQGEMVHIDLYAADAPTSHTWCIDYSGNNACEAGENESAVFSSMTVPVTHMFFATGPPGTYHYVCGIHGGIAMWGLFRITAAVVPSVSVSAPTSGVRWTGGSNHNIVWTMTDPNDPVTSLRAWLNYSTAGSSGPWTPIAGPILGSTNPHSFAWFVPVLNSSAYVNVTVSDPAGNRAFAVTPAFTIDSRAPSVTGRNPPNGSTGIPTTTNVIVTFDEAMNRTATANPVTAALQDLSTLAWVPVTYSWASGDTVLTMHPTATLSPTTMYRASVNVTARDASDPGNGLSAASAWSFTTATGADLVKPQISNVVRAPASAEYPNPVGVTATITDNDAVSSAYVNVTRPDTSRLNFSMAIVSGTTWGQAEVYATAPPSYLSMIGNYLFTVEAVDPSGNWNRSSQGTFTVRDTTPPSVSNLVATPSPAEVYEPVNVTVTVSDPFLVSVNLVANGTNSTMTRNPVTGGWYRMFTPMIVQTYPLVVWAGDRTPNYASVSGSLQAQDTKPPPMPMGLVARVTGTSVQLTWVAVTAPDLAGYRLYRAASSAGPFTTQVGPSTITGAVYVDQTALPGTTYYYAVTAVDMGGRESAHSNVASATLPVAPGFDVIPVVIAGVAIGIIVAALAVVLVLRRRREEPPKT